MDGLLRSVCCSNHRCYGCLWWVWPLLTLSTTHCTETNTVYVVQLYKNLGETGGIPLVLGAAYVTVAAASNFVGAFVMDKLGRINLLSMFYLSPISRIDQGFYHRKTRKLTINSDRPGRLHVFPNPRNRHGSALCWILQPRRQRHGRLLHFLLHFLLRWWLRHHILRLLQ